MPFALFHLKCILNNATHNIYKLIISHSFSNSNGILVIVSTAQCRHKKPMIVFHNESYKSQ